MTNGKLDPSDKAILAVVAFTVLYVVIHLAVVLGKAMG